MRLGREERGQGAACDEAERLWLEGSADPLLVSRVQAHLGRCQRCQGAHERLAHLKRNVERAVPPLDQVTRARLLAELAPALDALAAGERAPFSGGARFRLRQRVWGWLSARVLVPVALAAAMVLVWQLSDGRREVTSQVPVPPPAARGIPSPPSAAADRTADAPSLALLLPAPRQSARGARTRPMANAVSRLEVPSSRWMHANLAGRARIALAGPASLQVVAVRGGEIELRLTRGSLVMDYDRRQGGRLRIHSPGAVTEVVGTLFSVEVTGTTSRVAVARGQVAVESGGGARLLARGESLTSDAPVPQPLPAPTRALLRALDAPSEPAPVSRVAPVAPAPPASSPPPTPSPTPPLGPSPEPSSSPSPALEPAPVPAPPLPLAPAPLTAAARYRLAEQAMSRGDSGQARAGLQALISASPGDPLAAVARYELAQMALRAQDGVQALRWLDELTAAGGASGDLAEASSFLRCEALLASSDVGGARRCLRAFRQRHAGSSREPLAMGLELRLTPPAELCSGDRPLLQDFLRRFATHPLSAELRARGDACSR